MMQRTIIPECRRQLQRITTCLMFILKMVPHQEALYLPRKFNLKNSMFSIGAILHIFSLLTPVKQLLLVTFCDTTAGIGASFQTHRQTNKRMERQKDGQTDVEVERVI